MEVVALDRANGNEVARLSVQDAAERIARCLECDAGDIRSGLLAGQAFRTVGCHYEMTPESLAHYRAAKLEAEYDSLESR